MIPTITQKNGNAEGGVFVCSDCGAEVTMMNLGGRTPTYAEFSDARPCRVHAAEVQASGQVEQQDVAAAEVEQSADDTLPPPADAAAV